MADLYKGIAGSPITYLTADISANQTTISIDDDSALPDAPNICTIGYGEHLETIKYETKSNGVLQNVTRGIEGTPRAWQAGTEVARFFTAYDHNAIIEHFNSHLAESASKHITESGSNTSGEYIKFDDGTVFMHHRIVEQVDGNKTNTVAITLPAALLNTTKAQIIGSLVTASNNAANAFVRRAFFTSATSASVLIENTQTAAQNITFSFIVIGRWK